MISKTMLNFRCIVEVFNLLVGYAYGMELKGLLQKKQLSEQMKQLKSIIEYAEKEKKKKIDGVQAQYKAFLIRGTSFS